MNFPYISSLYINQKTNQIFAFFFYFLLLAYLSEDKVLIAKAL